MDKKYLVGSYALGLSNSKDADYVVIVDGYDSEYCVKKFEDGAEHFYETKANIDSFMLFERPFVHQNILRYAINYQYDQSIIDSEFPLKYNILDQRQKYVEMLNWIVDNKALNFNKGINLNNWKCSKLIYHVAYIVFILENNSTTLTSKQKAIVQKIHDKQMPIAYLDELSKRIKSLT